MASEIYDLRSALVFLAKQPGQLVETDISALRQTPTRKYPTFTVM